MADRSPLTDPRVQLAGLCAALLLVRLGSLGVVSQPGYTDAYYYVLVAERLAHGQGLSADFLWSPLEAGAGGLPVASHRFWMPLATVIQAAGIVVLEPLLGTFRAAQAPIVALAALIPAAAYAAARWLGSGHGAACVAATVAGLGGAFAPAWVSLDNFVPAALLGTAFFLCFARAARGDVRAGVGAGLAVGLLYLARAEGAAFGLALVALRSRSGLAGAAVALAVGLAWQVRQLGLGPLTELLERTIFLDRYEDFFAVRGPTAGGHLARWPSPLIDDLAALGQNAITLLVTFSLIFIPGLVAGVRALRHRPEVVAYAALLAGVTVVLSVVVTQHSIRGAYFHALAAFFPFGMALSVVGWRRMLAARRRPVLRMTAFGAIAASAVLSTVALSEWDRAFNGFHGERLAAARLVRTPVVAMDAAAWRWITGRPAVVTPADSTTAALCAMATHGAGTLLLEPAHFPAYAEAYRAARLDPLRAERSGRIVLLHLPPEGLDRVAMCGR